MRPHRAIAVVVLLAFSACNRVDKADHADGIRRIVTSTPAWVERTALGRQLWGMERAFYESRDHMPAWIDGTRPTDHMTLLIAQVRQAETHGLDPDPYGVDTIEQTHQEATGRFWTRFEPDDVPELDARLTYAYLRYAADLLGWSTDPAQVSAQWQAPPKKEDLAAHLSEALKSGRVQESLAALAPAHPQYTGLQAALARERQQPTGQEERLLMNLERWRWMPRDLGDRYVLVNVPGYVMQIMEGARPVLAMRVIVGQPDWPTPLFSDEMTHVIFSPYWNIPENIEREETLPQIARDPDFLLRNNIEVVGTSGVVDPRSIDWSDPSALPNLRFRQRPGANNALGFVKFMFPNRYSVYLHDTPSDRLFAREKRALSHGCIRVEDPLALAQYVLRDQPEWTTPRIQQAMHAGRERHVKLPEPLPVHIGYWTAWVGPDGQVAFTEDPYGIDAAHARRMNAGDRPARPDAKRPQAQKGQ